MKVDFINNYDLFMFEKEDKCPLCNQGLIEEHGIVYCSSCGCGIAHTKEDTNES